MSFSFLHLDQPCGLLFTLCSTACQFECPTQMNESVNLNHLFFPLSESRHVPSAAGGAPT